MYSRKISCITPFAENGEVAKLTADIFSKFENVETVGVKYAKEMPENLAEYAYAVPGVIEKAKEKQAEGYQGIIIGCVSDTGYLEAREVVNIPVVGPLHVSIVVANMIGYKFSIVVPLEMMAIGEEKAIRRYGLSDNLASIRCAPIPLSEPQDPQKTIKDTTEKMIECIEKDRASVIILGCLTLVNAIDKLREVITSKYNVPIINPVDDAYYMINALIDMKHNY